MVHHVVVGRSPTELTSDRTNFLYLSTLTRSSGLLLGAGAAFLWRPWRAKAAASSRAGAMLSVAGLAATMLLVCVFATTHLTDRSLYRWQLAVVSLLSLVVVAVVVHPAASTARSFFGSPALVAIGKRSYGIYLWSWPISVICGAYVGSWTRFIAAMSVTIVVSEFSYKYIETPIRKGGLRRWFDRHRDSHLVVAHDWRWESSARRRAGRLPRSTRGVERFDRAAGGRRRGDRPLQGAIARSARSPGRRCRSRRRSTRGAAPLRLLPRPVVTRRHCPTVGQSLRRVVQPPGPRSRRDRRRLAGALVGDQPSIRHRQRVHDQRRLGRGLQRVRRRQGALGAQRLQSIVRRLRWLGRQVGQGGEQGQGRRSRSSCWAPGTCSTSRSMATSIPFNTPAADQRFIDEPRSRCRRAACRRLEGCLARGAVHASARCEGCRGAGAPRTRRRCPCCPSQPTAAPGRGHRSGQRLVRQRTDRVVQRSRRSPPISATAGTVCTCTSRAPS